MTDLTPETLDPNANPKTLRLLANLILRGVSFQEIAVVESLRLCASAWAADRKARDYYVAEMRLAEDRAEKAEARIEALEKEIDIGEVEGDIGAHRLHELRAALRGEEEK